MYEYQKHAVFRGFISFQGSQKGVSAWMCDGRPCPPNFSSLPSTNWSWMDSSWHLEDEEWKYSNEIDGTYDYNERGQGRARRRLWIRRARYDCNKSPWCHVEAPPMKYIRLAKQASTVYLSHIQIRISCFPGNNYRRSFDQGWSHITTKRSYQRKFYRYKLDGGSFV